MATNDDDNLLKFIANSVMELGDNLTAVGANVEKLESKVDNLESKVDNLESTTRTGFESVNADLTALRGDMEQVHIRHDNIDKALTSEVAQIRTEVSRL